MKKIFRWLKSIFFRRTIVVGNGTYVIPDGASHVRLTIVGGGGGSAGSSICKHGHKPYWVRPSPESDMLWFCRNCGEKLKGAP